MFSGFVLMLKVLVDSVPQNLCGLQDALQHHGHRVRSRRFGFTSASTATRCSNSSCPMRQGLNERTY